MDLKGATVAVTRPRAQAVPMAAALESAGARVLLAPLIRITPTRAAAALKRAAAAPNRFDWIVFTSANAVDALFAEIPGSGAEIRASVACVGPGTADAVRTHGVVPALVSAGRTAEHLLAELVERDVSGKRILLPQAAAARPVMSEGLRAAGAELEAIEAYRTEGDAARAQELGAVCRGGAVDWLTFTASSAVRTFVAGAGTEIGVTRVAVIGPVTAKTARGLDLRVDVEAVDHTIDGLIAAIDAASE